MRYTSSAVTFAVLVILQSGPPLPVENLVADVTKLASAKSNEDRFEALTQLLRASDLPFVVEAFTIDKPVGLEPRTEGRNVVVSVGEGSELVIVGAHYDAARLKDGSLSEGAVDNASSSVLLIRLADVLRSLKLPLRAQLVWFDMEELGLHGSAAFAQRHASEKAVAMVNLDINAYGDTVLFGPSADTRSLSLRGTLLTACASEHIDCVAFPQMPPGDDRTFTARGVPTVSLAILPAVEVHQLWLMLNAGPNSLLHRGGAPSIVLTVHTNQDVVAKVSGESMSRVLRLVVATLRALVAK